MSPTMAEKLTSQSSQGQISAAISESVRKLMDEGYPQHHAVAIRYEQARKATGKELARK